MASKIQAWASSSMSFLNQIWQLRSNVHSLKTTVANHGLEIAQLQSQGKAMADTQVTLQQAFADLKASEQAAVAKIDTAAALIPSLVATATTLNATIVSLQAQIAAGEPVSAADLEALSADLASHTNGLIAVLAPNTPPVVPVTPTPTPDPTPVPSPTPDPVPVPDPTPTPSAT